MTLRRYFDRPVFWLVTWLAVNFLQAALTPLDPDETYYWMYSRFLDWGYFDHPPAVAVLIASGKDWLPGALGLRFGHVVAGGLTLAALYELLGRPRGSDLLLAVALAFAQPLLQVYGFIATPDGPLLLFTSLYLLALQRFLRQPAWKSSVLLGITMAGLLYSKYHGVLLIFFTALPHLRFLIRTPRAWVAAGTGLILFLPHLYWQYAHDYPSFRYHLSGRDDPYQWKFTWQYVLNQLLVFSPLLLVYYFRGWRFTRTANRFVQSLRWLIAGTLLFFLYTTTKGRTEAQWTAMLSIPLVLLTYRAAREYSAKFGGLRAAAWSTVGLLVVARLLLLAPRAWLPFAKPFDHEPWVQRMVALAGDRPVIVENSYRFASLYEFYSGGRPGWTITNVDYRPSQYDLWGRDSLYHGREVMVLGQNNWKQPAADSFAMQKGFMRTMPVGNFQVVKDLELELEAHGYDTLRIYVTAPRPVSLTGPLPLHLRVIGRRADGSFTYRRLPMADRNAIPAHRRILLYAGPNPFAADWRAHRIQLGAGLAYAGMPPLRGQSDLLPDPG